MFLGADQVARLAGGGYKQLGIQRLDRRHADDTSSNTFACQLLCRFQRSRKHHAIRDDRHIAALPQNFPFANDETMLWPEDDRQLVAIQPQVDRAGILGHSSDSQPSLGGVGRRHDRHSREATHHRHVADRVVGRAIERVRDTGVVCRQLDSDLRICQTGPDLLGRPERK